MAHNYRTAGSGEGLRLPHSGVLIGCIANALRLKAGLRELLGDAGYKTSQRYFDGDRIEPEAMARILDALAIAVPESLALPKESGSTEALRSFIAGGLKFHAQRWDSIAARTNALSFPVTERRDQPIPALRLFVLDIGLRWGAWRALQAINGYEIRPSSWWLQEDAVGTLIDGWRQNNDVSLEALAEKAEVSVQTLYQWRSGTALPTARHLKDVTAALSDGELQQAHKEWVLRLVIGVLDLRRELATLCGRKRIDDMTNALVRSAELIHESFLAARAATAMNDEALVPRLWNVVFFGGRSPVAADLCAILADRAAFAPEVARDFAALTQDWAERMHYWMHFLGSVPDGIAFARARLRGQSEAEVAGLVRGTVEASLRMSGFDAAPPDTPYDNRIAMPPELRAIHRGVQAEAALSVDDLDGALEHLRAAVQHDPRSPVVHFKLGAALGMQGLRHRDAAMMDEGVLECRLAYQLDPDFGNARNEIGIILSNMRRHEEAEVAFAEAEPYFGSHAHHWFTRGANLLALHRLEDAREAFQKAIELTKDGAHVEAMARLAAVLLKLGDHGKARRLGRKVHHLIGQDPCNHVEALLDVFKGNPFPVRKPQDD